jgi:hypothetical protein
VIAIHADRNNGDIVSEMRSRTLPFHDREEKVGLDLKHPVLSAKYKNKNVMPTHAALE